MSTAANFDQNFYLTNNLDVVVAISQGQFANALDHYNKFGGKELRAPNATFNPSFYAIANPDVLAAVSSGGVNNVFNHYQEFGETENRAPSSDFSNFTADAYLTANADVAAAVTAGTIASALDHFITFGQNEARTGSGITETVTTGSTFTLTSGADSGASFVGTANADTFNATLVNEGGVANVQTLNNLDSLDGGDGTDTLNVTIRDTSTTPSSLANIENIVITAVGTDNIADTISLANAAALTSVTFDSSTEDSIVSVTNVQNILSGAQGITIKNTAVDHTISSANAALTGTTDAVTINLESVTAGTMVVQPASGTGGYETFTINSGGTVANTITEFNDATSTAGTTLNITGAQDLTITNALQAETLTVNGADATGDITLDLTTAAVRTVTGGSGSDSFDLSGSFVDQTTAASADTVTGGDGTDTLTLSSAEVVAVGSAAQFSGVTGIETVIMDTVTAATSNFSFLTGVTTIEFDGGFANGFTHTVSSGQEMQFDVADTSDDAATFVITGNAVNDVMNIDINDADMGAGTITYTGIETVNIATSGTSLLDGAHTLTDTAANQTLNISGTGTLTLGAITADTVVSTMTGTGTTTYGTLAATTNFTGGANIDVIVGSTRADILTGGAGADNITNTATGARVNAGDIITTGDGFDTVTLVGTTASATNYNASSNITDYTVGTTATTTDLIRLSSADNDYEDDNGAAAGLASVANANGAAGAVVVQNVAQNAAAAAGATGVELIKLTTGVAFNTNIQTTFNDAIGTSIVNGLIAESVFATTFYDTTNEVMVIVGADANAGIAISLETADVVRLIGTVNMTAAEYALIDADNFANFA